MGLGLLGAPGALSAASVAPMKSSVRDPPSRVKCVQGHSGEQLHNNGHDGGRVGPGLTQEHPQNVLPHPRVACWV